MGVQLWVAEEPAQSQPVTSPTTDLSVREWQESERLRESQRAQSVIQQELEMRKTVQDEVDRAFNRTTTLLNFLLGTLTILPIIATVLLYLSRQRAIQALREQIEEQIQKEIETQVKADLKQQSLLFQQQMMELQQQSLLAKDQMQQQAATFQEEIDQLKIEFDAELEKLKNTTTEIEREKSRIIQEITSITLVSTSKDVLSPEKQRQIQTLTQQLDDLKSKSPSLDLEINDFIREGDALFFEGRYQEAIASYDQAINKAMSENTNLFTAWHGKTKALRRLKQYAQALDANTKAMMLKPNDPLMWFERGYLLQLQGQYAEALDAYDKVITAKPGYHRARNHRGYILLKLQQYEEAIVELNKGIELKPDYGNGYYGKAYYYLLHHQTDLALDNLKTAISFYPGYKTLAKADPDFASLWKNDRFQTIVGSA